MEPEKKSSGALIGLIVIIIILVIGGIYMWMSNKNTANKDKTNNQIETVTTIETDSAELDSLQQEIDTTDTDVGASVIDSIQ